MKITLKLHVSTQKKHGQTRKNICAAKKTKYLPHLVVKGGQLCFGSVCLLASSLILKMSKIKHIDPNLDLQIPLEK